MMTHFYTTRAKFDKDNDTEILAWSSYIEWSKLIHLTELVSIDTSLNEVLVEPDRTSEEDWKEIVIDDYYETGFYRTLDYVLQKTKEIKRFNLLAVVIEPKTDCSLIRLYDYDFLGYDLLDRYYNTSALTNCGGFDETFLPNDLNNVGLIEAFEKAYSIKKSLRENNPLEEHADTNVIAIWRHRSIGY
jgi:hypothetical protein